MAQATSCDATAAQDMLAKHAPGRLMLPRYLLVRRKVSDGSVTTMMFRCANCRR